MDNRALFQLVARYFLYGPRILLTHVAAPEYENEVEWFDHLWDFPKTLSDRSRSARVIFPGNPLSIAEYK